MNREDDNVKYPRMDMIVQHKTRGDLYQIVEIGQGSMVSIKKCDSGEVNKIFHTDLVDEFEICRDPEKQREYAQMAESQRLFHFFKGRGPKESAIILEGRCPECDKKGKKVDYKIGPMGAKLCPHCPWRE